MLGVKDGVCVDVYTGVCERERQTDRLTDRQEGKISKQASMVMASLKSCALIVNHDLSSLTRSIKKTSFSMFHYTDRRQVRTHRLWTIKSQMKEAISEINPGMIK